MGRLRKLALDTALLSGSSIVMRCIALAFQVWLAGRVGSAGIGLFQLVMSVNVLSVTLAISGIRFTTTRLISEEIGSGNIGSIGKAMRRCIAYSMFFGGAAFVILFLCAEPIGFLWIGDARTVQSLRIVAFTLPAISISSVLNGYFVASGRVYKTAIIQVVEQLTNIAAVVIMLSSVEGSDLEKCCSCITFGGAIADYIGLVIVVLTYIFDRRKHGLSGGESVHLTSRMLKIAVPLAVSAYARTSLTTLQNMLVPRKLRASGLSANSALSGYGTITGMVFPIISFPTCLLSALAELSIPELTEAQVAGDTEKIESTVSALLRTALIFSLATAVFIFLTADALGGLIYGTDTIGVYIRLFALIIPVMYMDIVCDGCLKGLGQMMYSMCYNIAEALIGVVLVVTILPRWALNGYIFVLFFSEVFNFSLSISRLSAVTKIRLWSKKEKQKPHANSRANFYKTK